MPVRSARLAAVTAVAALALVGTACGTGEPGGTTGTPATSAPAAAPGLPEDRVGQLHRTALGLLALGELGAEKGGTQALRALAARTTSDGRSLDEQIRALATAHGLALGDDVGAGTQAVLADLGARSGPTFDQAWLGAVRDLVTQGREAVGALLSDPGTPAQAASAARNLRARLEALTTALQRATARAGSAPSTR